MHGAAALMHGAAACMHGAAACMHGAAALMHGAAACMHGAAAQPSDKGLRHACTEVAACMHRAVFGSGCGMSARDVPARTTPRPPRYTALYSRVALQDPPEPVYAAPKLAVAGGHLEADRGHEPREVPSPEGRHCHSTLPLTAVDCHSIGICTVILRSMPSYFFCRDGSAALG